jgi:DNA polymerase-4
MEEDSLRGQTFTLQLKYNNFKMVSKSVTLTKPTNNSYQMIRIYIELFEELYDPDFAVRLVGVASSKLSKGKENVVQMSIFDELDKESLGLEVSKVINNINSIVGANSLKLGINKKPKE